MKMEKTKISPQQIDAVIFDMDGVVTETAGTHAAAWKQMFDEYLGKRAEKHREQFQPFDIDNDYRQYVDGKPRYDGVMSFLESRGISLPYGSPEDSPEQETVSGLGNRKNRIFLEKLKNQEVKPYASSVKLIEQLRKKGFRTAIISASRNAGAVLESASIRGLFDVKVDGVDASELQLKGKPDPAIFLEAASRLNIEPEKTAIVEDSLAGVEAGRRGKFRLVIGVDRTDHYERYKEKGADVVVADLSQIEVNLSSPRRSKHARKNTRNLPSALDNRDAILARLRERTPAIFLDYDGTLTPIVETPEKAVLSDKTRKVLKRLVEHYSVTVISGRDLHDVQNMVNIGDIAYAGSHGFDIEGPGGNYRDDKKGESFLPALEKAENELHKVLDGIAGAQVERKRYAIAVHYRRVAADSIGTIEKRFDDVASHYSELRKTTGKKVFELRPDIDWNKGKALLSLLEALYTDDKQVLPLYIGDDVTDEDAFRAIGDRGITIVVSPEERRTAAQYLLKDTEEVVRFLEALAVSAEGEVSRGVWVMAYEGFDPEREGLRETLCTLGNGYFATRGAAPESSADNVHYPGTYITGCYNRLITEIDGQTVENESMVNVPNWLPLSFRFDNDDWFDVGKVDVLEYQQELNVQQGVLSRLVRFTDRKGHRTRISQRRFVSMASSHLAGLETTIVAENWSGNILVRSALDGRITNNGVERYRQLNGQHLTQVQTKSEDEETIFLQVETNQSHIRIAEAARTRLSIDDEPVPVKPDIIEEPGYIAQEFAVELEEGRAATIEKVVAVCTSNDHAISESGIKACKSVKRAADFDKLLERHILAWNHLWQRCRITISDSERVALVLHLHIFHLLQTVSPHTIGRDVGVPPRGLHGEAYRGHILWDELFIFPFLNLRIPDITRTLLMYRYRRLPEARWMAKQAGYRGAMYPWQSGSDGREESQILHLNPRSGRWIPDNSHLQRHINIAIAYNVWHYYQVSGDINFLSFYGAEMLVEITRFWASIVHYNRSLDRYEIHKVMGPDEFHDAYPDADEPGIDNNAYTNIMAVWVLCRTLDAIELIPDVHRQALWDKLSVRQEEIEKWQDISRKMRVVFHDDNIISQFEGYDKLEEFDWEGYQEKYGNIHRLDRILEAEGDTPNRYKLSKQADVLMLFYLLSADELGELFQRLNYKFEYDTIPRNIEYYLKRTSHGSTLSRVVHAWVLARSRRELSWHLFKEALESDVSDVQGGTTPEGIHLGAMAGTVDLIQRCYTGIETRENVLRLNPYLPNDLKEIRFDIMYRQHWINVIIHSDKLQVSARTYAVAPITIGYQEDTAELKPGDTLQFDLL